MSKTYLGKNAPVAIYKDDVKLETISITNDNLSTYFDRSSGDGDYTFVWDSSYSRWKAKLPLINSGNYYQKPNAEIVLTPKQTITDFSLSYSVFIGCRDSNLKIFINGVCKFVGDDGTAGRYTYSEPLEPGDTIKIQCKVNGIYTGGASGVVTNTYFYNLSTTTSTPIKVLVSNDVKEVARNLNNIYLGVDGVAQKIKRGYIGVNGVAKRIYEKLSTPTYLGSSLQRSTVGNGVATSNKKYAFFVKTSDDVDDVFDRNLVKTSLQLVSHCMDDNSVGCTSFGEYALFAGGWNGTSYLNKMIAYDTNLVDAKPTNITYARRKPYGASNKNFALFAGDGTPDEANQVIECYDKSLVKSLVAGIGEGQTIDGGASSGNCAMFCSHDTSGAFVYGYTDNLVQVNQKTTQYGHYKTGLTFDEQPSFFGKNDAGQVIRMFNSNMVETEVPLNVSHDFNCAVAVNDVTYLTGQHEDPWYTNRPNKIYAINSMGVLSSFDAQSFYFGKATHGAKVGDYALIATGYTYSSVSGGSSTTSDKIYVCENKD